VYILLLSVWKEWAPLLLIGMGTEKRPETPSERRTHCPRAGRAASEIEPDAVLPPQWLSRVAHLNQYETDYVYKEIFEDECYTRHGIRLPDGATVVDIGANIGLFSLFALSRSPNAKIYAFEPAPLVTTS
jgi:hypothetical protein